MSERHGIVQCPRCKKIWRVSWGELGVECTCHLICPSGDVPSDCNFKTGGGQFPSQFPSSKFGQDLVLYLSLDEGSGSIAYDQSEQGNNGAISGAVWVDGKYGKALSFDGVNNWVKIFNNNSLNPNYITLHIWMKVPTDVTGYGRLVAKGVTAQYLLSIGDSGAGRIRWIVNRASDGTYDLVDSDTAYNDNVWHHVVASWDGTTIRLYVDSAEIKNKLFSGTLKVTGNDVGIAANQTGAENLKCVIDEVRIYNRSLTLEEITLYYLSGPPQPSPYLQLGYPTGAHLGSENEGDDILHRMGYCSTHKKYSYRDILFLEVDWKRFEKERLPAKLRKLKKA